MNGFADRGLDEGNFGDSGGFSVRSFDAFPKTKQTYLTKTRNGHVWTYALVVTTLWLLATEVGRWLTGTTTHTFSVEKGVARTLQINLDIVVPMSCGDLHINVQDAAGDRIMAGDALRKDHTNWATWTSSSGLNTAWGGGGGREGDHGKGWEEQQARQYGREEDVHDYLASAKGRRKFKSTPKAKKPVDACRVFGSMEANKVQGDFHITARGHGYQEAGEHLDHSRFNFSHHINELSFGPFYPSLLNPLDATSATTDLHFYKYQYYLSIVPTIYTDALYALTSLSPPGPNDKGYNPYQFAPHTVFTNQYAVTEQSQTVAENAVPGIFVKYDIEPILLTVSEEWDGLLALIIRCVNVTAGVLVAGGWIVSMVDWSGDFIGRRRRGQSSADGGLLHGKAEKAGLD